MVVQEVWANNKLQCIQISADVTIKGPDPRPQKQYPFLREADKSMEETIHALMEQGVLIGTQSTVSSPTWPVHKPDSIT